LLAALLTGGLPHAEALARSQGVALAAPLPAPLLPVQAAPAQPSQGFAPAPVPNVDLDPPRAAQPAERPRAEISPDLFIRREELRGNGFTTGSAGRYEADRRMRVTPGINLKVPLQ